jgi:two-component system sensor histidine kinase HydH
VNDRSRPYAAPVLVAVILSLGLGIWAWQDVRRLDRFRVDQVRQFADGLHQSFRLAWQEMADAERRDPDALQRRLDALVAETDQVTFAELRRGPPGPLRAGAAPAGIAVHGTVGEQVTEAMYLSWRPLELASAPPERPPTGGGAAAATGPPPPHLVGPSPTLAPGPVLAPPRPPILIFGLRKELPAQTRREELNRTGLIFGAAFFAVFAFVAAWIQGIRSRALAARLRLERTRRGHLEELSLVAAGLAHETKNPLGVIRGIAQRMLADPGGDPEEAAEQIIDAADQAAGRLGEFINYARHRTPALRPLAAAEVVERALGVLDGDAASLDVELAREVAGLHLLADEDMLIQVILNLVLNALQAVAPGGRIRVAVTSGSRGGLLVVEDDGPGIPAALADQVLKPYVTGREGGHGMGLAIVRRIVEQHGWDIDLDSAEGRGTRVTIRGIRVVAPGKEAT